MELLEIIKEVIVKGFAGVRNNMYELRGMFAQITRSFVFTLWPYKGSGVVYTLSTGPCSPCAILKKAHDWSHFISPCVFLTSDLTVVLIVRIMLGRSWMLIDKTLKL